MIHRVSNLEAFRQWEEDDDATLNELLERLRPDSAASAAMRAGTAFHKALEFACTGVSLDYLEADGHRFMISEDLSVDLPVIRELRAAKTYSVDGKPFVLSGQVDAIDGKRVDDHKTTGRFDPDRYLAGYQWRLYLSIFGADRFRWNIFEIAEQSQATSDDDAIVYEVRAAHRLEQYRYPQMEADCLALVQRYARFHRDYMAVTA